MAIKITGTNTAAAPGITGDDTDTGLVYGTNQVEISTGGSSRVTVDSNGDLGIGTAPNNFGSYQTLHIKGPSSEGAAIRLQDNGDTADSSDAAIYKNATALYLRVNGTDPIIAYMNGNERIRVLNSGRVGIRTDSPGCGLNVKADGNDSDGIQCTTADYSGYVWQIQSSGNLFNGSLAGELGIRGQSGVGFSANGGSSAQFRIESDGDLVGADTSIGSISDSRVKKNVADYTYDLAKFKQLTPKTFDWINPDEHLKDTNVRGFLAQDVKTIDDYWIKETDSVNKLDKELIGEGKALSSKLGSTDAMYVSVIKQLIAKIEILETKVAALESHTHE